MSAKTANPVETHTPHVTADTLVADHRALVVRRLLIIAVLIFCALVAFIVSTVVGPVNISVGDVIVGIFRPETLDRQSYTVIWKLRLPMSVMALLVGMALSVAGAQMQTILGNPLAEPFTLGIAAAFGGASSIVFGLIFLPNAQLNIALIAWFAAMTASLVIVLASLFRGASAETMILLGIGLVFLFQALLALIQYKASTEALQQIVFWILGSLTRASWIGNGILAVVLVCCLPIFMGLSWQLTALRLGDARARAMGVNVTRLRVIVLIVVSLLAATSVAFSGIIGFVGLVGPHVARMLVGEDQRYFIPASLASGALMMSTAHAVSLIITPGLAIPIGIVTSLVGVPFFIFIIMTRKRALW